MNPFFANRNLLILAIIIITLIAGVLTWYFLTTPPETTPMLEPPIEEQKPKSEWEVIGRSVEGRKIEAYTYGKGTTRLLFVGGIHGGYEWNSVFLAYRVMDYLEANPDVIADNISVTVIPSLNPDGVYTVIGKEGRFAVEDVPDAANTDGTGRFNGNGVDLNRNFDCKWQPESTWRGNTVRAGTAAFSEPEAAAVRDYVNTNRPTAVVFWHSQANAVYASECKKGILPATLTLMNAYAKAGGYPAVDSFDAYPVSGDAESWLASIGIPAITVELSSRDTTEWDKNLPALLAVLKQYGN